MISGLDLNFENLKVILVLNSNLIYFWWTIASLKLITKVIDTNLRYLS